MRQADGGGGGKNNPPAQDKGKGKGKQGQKGNPQDEAKVKAIVAHNKGVAEAAVEEFTRKIAAEVAQDKKHWLYKTVVCPHVVNDRPNGGAIHCQKSSCDFLHGFKALEGTLMPKTSEGAQKLVDDNKGNLDSSAAFRDFCGKVNPRLDRLFALGAAKGKGKGKGGKGKGKW